MNTLLIKVYTLIEVMDVITAWLNVNDTLNDFLRRLKDLEPAKIITGDESGMLFSYLSRSEDYTELHFSPEDDKIIVYVEKENLNTANAIYIILLYEDGDFKPVKNPIENLPY